MATVLNGLKDVHTDYKDRRIFTRLLCKIYNFNNNYIYTSLRLLNTCNGTKFITQGVHD